MKEIKAFVRTYMVEKIIEELRAIEGLPGITVSDIRGFGSTAAEEAPHGGTDDEMFYADRSKVEVFVSDGLVDPVVGAIQRSARTGRIGDGHIFVIDVVDAVKIRTGERGEKAL